ncbi:Dihydrofolate synthetase [Pseudozyma hubeiensis SY62]|uniref:Dihydrofolate synthetase n=1 Tax=Pseudozyma hubeiensis (strain SY62) TaxID=1305764 RepID=R9P564_PSEHS|nr:Dihydrofolate synthetase [Pseudozyma hubeiensis SY62]GAC96347.1 Dihydrofolate synthetase [Pseudozyma hubeiensis SY62]
MRHLLRSENRSINHLLSPPMTFSNDNPVSASMTHFKFVQIRGFGRRETVSDMIVTLHTRSFFLVHLAGL